MLNFGLSLGSGGALTCTRPVGEAFDNRHFDCGIANWETNSYGGIMEPAGPSLLRLTATSEYSSITQTDKFPLTAGSYHLGVVVTECSGSGKFAYKLWDGTWHTAITFSTPGTYEVDITTDQDIVAMDIGAHGDATFTAVFDGISCMDATLVHYPDWWQIDTLDDADILGAWDMIWPGATDTPTALTNLHGTMPGLSTVAGAPSLRVGEGLNFGGGGCVASNLPDGIDHNNISVIMQVDGVIQNATLDAFFSHYLDTAHFTLQNGWGGDEVRWSCGSGDSTTITTGSVMTSGVIGVSGRRLYIDGAFVDEVPESGEALTSGNAFHLGAIRLSDGRIVQFMRGRVQRLLIVQRPLTDDEQQQIYTNMTS